MSILLFNFFNFLVLRIELLFKQCYIIYRKGGVTNENKQFFY
nr:MAG TPA: hypothetical protein [Bacteriophage sp.]